MLTTCASTAEVLALNVASNWYLAVILLVPADRPDVVSEAEPAVSGAVPIVTPALRKVINSPSGGVPPAEVTVAVNVTDWPTSDGFSEEVTLVVVENFATTDSLRTADVLAVLFVSPAYCAVMERVPGLPNAVVKLA